LTKYKSVYFSIPNEKIIFPTKIVAIQIIKIKEFGERIRTNLEYFFRFGKYV